MKSIFQNNQASNPIATLQTNTPQKLKDFAQKHTGKFIVGYISYDLGHSLYQVPQTAKDDLQLPKIYFNAYENFEQKTLPNKKNTPHISTNFQPTITAEQYKKAYQKIKEYIRLGHIYQINLTHRLEAETTMPAEELFHKVSESNPVDFLSYIEGPEFEIISASPERFIKIQNGIIETNPIKGTRPRGTTEEEDKMLAQELLDSEKEAAELNMITDLLRNDIGKVSKPGSVKVAEHRSLQKCPTVWHTYSRITGEVAAGLTPLDALLSMFPGGSITGCPKKRAIEIIDELEPKTRSAYTGCIVQILPDGTLDSSIAIRTIIKKGNKLYLQVGGGIVLDSKEHAEFEETLQKAASFMKILT